LLPIGRWPVTFWIDRRPRSISSRAWGLSPSMAEPFIVKLKGGDFDTVPHTFHMKDIVSFPFQA
jgi:hypothetical protein